MLTLASLAKKGLGNLPRKRQLAAHDVADPQTEVNGESQQSEQQRFHHSEYKLYVAEHYASQEFLSDLKREITDPLRDRHAEQCRKLAAACSTQQLKATFLSVSRNWEMLAIQLEDAFAKLVEDEAIWLNVRESLNENKRLSDLPFWKK